ncbi:MAG: hypothetical protein OEZ01_13355 [Candidatus Heimdallarchaeota archaeon]|nr:hypothetical protein [Candidatus Heimdallarchaeota archaeon]MDH5646994.1 hypothetical protein [Candidatus Heimdallarchaeota archaeon]
MNNQYKNYKITILLKRNVLVFFLAYVVVNILELLISPILDNPNTHTKTFEFWLIADLLLFIITFRAILFAINLYDIKQMMKYLEIIDFKTNNITNNSNRLNQLILDIPTHSIEIIKNSVKCFIIVKPREINWLFYNTPIMKIAVAIENKQNLRELIPLESYFKEKIEEITNLNKREELMNDLEKIMILETNSSIRDEKLVFELSSDYGFQSFKDIINLFEYFSR